jgi:hypothetical protein
MQTIKTLAIIVGIILAGVLTIKFVPVFIDINGLESDLNKHAADLAVECVGDPGCQDDLAEQIEMVRTANRRDVTLIYETLDYASTSNKLFVEGYKVIDLYATKYTWKFTLTIELLL